MDEYFISVFYSKEDKAWVADIPDLKYCSATGATPAEAVAEVQKAKKAWLASAKAHKHPIPKPRYRPAIYQTV